MWGWIGMSLKYSKMEEIKPDNTQLLQLLEYKMPFGKFKGRFLIDIPEPYLVWMNRQGFPKGKLGDLLRLTYEIKLNGLEGMVKRIRE